MKAARRLAYHFFTEYQSRPNGGGGGRPATVPCGWPSRRSNPLTRTAAANVVTTKSDCVLFFVSALFSSSLFARMTVPDDSGGRRWHPLPAASFPIDLAMTRLRLARPQWAALPPFSASSSLPSFFFRPLYFFFINSPATPISVLARHLNNGRPSRNSRGRSPFLPSIYRPPLRDRSRLLT